MRGRSHVRTARSAKKSRRQLNPRTIYIACKKATDSTESSSSLAPSRLWEVLGLSVFLIVPEQAWVDVREL